MRGERIIYPVWTSGVDLITLERQDPPLSFKPGSLAQALWYQGEQLHLPPVEKSLEIALDP